MQRSMIANMGQQNQDLKVAALIEQIYAIGNTQAIVADLNACHESLKSPAKFAEHADIFALLNATAIAGRLHNFAIMFTNLEIQLAQGQLPPDLLQQTKAAALEQLQLLSPPFIRNFSLSLVDLSIKEIVHNLRTKLISLTKSTEVSEFTAKTARASLEKIILLAQYLDIPNASQRALALNKFGATNQAESHRYLAKLSDNKINLTECSKIYAELVSMMTALQQYPTQGSQSNLVKLLLLNIPYNQSLTCTSIYTQAMCMELASEFYTHTLFDHTPTEAEFSEFTSTIPKTIRLSLKGVIMQVCGSALQLAQEHFPEHLFSIIHDPEDQRTCFELVAESVLSATPQVFEFFVDNTFTPYCEQHPGTAQTKILEEVCAKCKAKLAELQITQLNPDNSSDEDELGELSVSMRALLQQATHEEQEETDESRFRSSK